MATNELYLKLQYNGSNINVGTIQIDYSTTNSSITFNTIKFIRNSTAETYGISENYSLQTADNTYIRLIKDSVVTNKQEFYKSFNEGENNGGTINITFNNLNGSYTIRFCTLTDNDHFWLLDDDSRRYFTASNWENQITFSGGSSGGGGDSGGGESGSGDDDAPSYIVSGYKNTIITANKQDFDHLRESVAYLIQKRSYESTGNDTSSFEDYSNTYKNTISNSLESKEVSPNKVTDTSSGGYFAGAVNIIYDLIKNNYMKKPTSSTEKTAWETIAAQTEPKQNSIIPALSDYFTIVNYWNAGTDSDNKCNGACTGFCSGSCSGTTGGETATYNDDIQWCPNACTGSCHHQCYNKCEHDCQADCSTVCSIQTDSVVHDNCIENCVGSCRDGCEESCEGTCGGNNCGNGCNTCSNECNRQCSGTCQEECSTCTGTSTGPFPMTINGCNNNCTSGCQTSCSETCTFSCSETCKGTATST